MVSLSNVKLEIFEKEPVPPDRSMIRVSYYKMRMNNNSPIDMQTLACGFTEDMNNNFFV